MLSLAILSRPLLVFSSSSMFVRILTITSNYTYVHVVLRNMVPSLGPIIMSMCESLLTQALRFARMSYLESWNIVVQSLQDGTSVPRPVPSQQRSMLSNPFLYVGAAIYYVTYFQEIFRTFRHDGQGPSCTSPFT